MTEIVRHSRAVRACHWLIAISGLLLAFSGIGFMPLYGRFYLNDIPGLAWVSDFAVQMTLHYISASIFLAAGSYHLIYHWRRREFAALPKKGDLGESWQIIKAMLSGRQEPPHGKFLAEQRLAYAAFVVTILVLVGSGYFLIYKNSASQIVEPITIQLMTLLHLTFTFIFLGQVGLHLAAFALKSNRPLLGSMITGRVSRAYAEKRHGKWLK